MDVELCFLLWLFLEGSEASGSDDEGVSSLVLVFSVSVSFEIVIELLPLLITIIDGAVCDATEGVCAVIGGSISEGVCSAEGGVSLGVCSAEGGASVGVCLAEGGSGTRKGDGIGEVGSLSVRGACLRSCGGVSVIGSDDWPFSLVLLTFLRMCVPIVCAAAFSVGIGVSVVCVD